MRTPYFATNHSRFHFLALELFHLNSRLSLDSRLFKQRHREIRRQSYRGCERVNSKYALMFCGDATWRLPTSFHARCQDSNEETRCFLGASLASSVQWSSNLNPAKNPWNGIGSSRMVLARSCLIRINVDRSRASPVPGVECPRQKKSNSSVGHRTRIQQAVRARPSTEADCSLGFTVAERERERGGRIEPGRATADAGVPPSPRQACASYASVRHLQSGRWRAGAPLDGTLIARHKQ